MQWIFELIVRYKTLFSLFFTSFVSLGMIFSSSEHQVATTRFLTATVFYPLQLTFNQISLIENVFSENRRLKMHNAQLNVKISALQEQIAEYQRLRELIDFSKDWPYELVPARVVARDPSLAYRSVVINTGKKDSVINFMPVVTERGVVGKVIQSLNGISLVQLLKDPSNRISVLSRRNRTVAILETDDGQHFFMRVRSHEDFQVGDTIVTSGLGGIYPRGLEVGFVKDVKAGSDPLFKRVFIRPTVDFEHLEELFVIRLSPQWASFLSEMDSIEFNDND